MTRQQSPRKITDAKFVKNVLPENINEQILHYLETTYTETSISTRANKYPELVRMIREQHPDYKTTNLKAPKDWSVERKEQDKDNKFNRGVKVLDVSQFEMILEQNPEELSGWPLVYWVLAVAGLRIGELLGNYKVENERLFVKPLKSRLEFYPVVFAGTRATPESVETAIKRVQVEFSDATKDEAKQKYFTTRATAELKKMDLPITKASEFRDAHANYLVRNEPNPERALQEKGAILGHRPSSTLNYNKTHFAPDLVVEFIPETPIEEVVVVGRKPKKALDFMSEKPPTELAPKPKKPVDGECSICQLVFKHKKNLKRHNTSKSHLKIFELIK